VFPKYPKKVQPYIQELRSLAAANPTQEVCGVILPAVGIVQSKNVAPIKETQFKLAANVRSRLNAYVAKNGTENVFIYHSHPQDFKAYPDSLDFSSMDIRNLDEQGIAGLLIHTQTGSIRHYCPNDLKAFEGRYWATTYQNCYSLIRDFYIATYGLKLGRYYLESVTSPQDESWRLFEDHIEAEGFRQVDDLATGDLVLFKIGKTHNCNHIGVISDVEKNLLLHHPGNKTSLVEPYGKLLRRLTHSVWRHGTNDK